MPKSPSLILSMAALLALWSGLAAGCSDDSPGSNGGAGAAGGTGGSGPGGAGGGLSVSCTSEDDCGGVNPHCDTSAGKCTGCKNDDDCRGALLCNTQTGICRDCVSDAQCGGSRPICDAVSGQCTARCTSDAECANTGGPTKCDTRAGRGLCVDCTGPNAPCQFCETVSFSCVGCLTDADCPTNFPHCGPSLECSPACQSDDDCPGELHCDPKTSRCLECVTNKDCPGEVCQVDSTCG